MKRKCRHCDDNVYKPSVNDELMHVGTNLYLCRRRDKIVTVAE